MLIKQVVPFAAAGLILSLAFPPITQAQTAPGKIYNTVKTKLQEGKQVVGATITSPDPDSYCAVANSGFDFLWIEMQHSPLTYQEAAKMIASCKGASGIPFIRVPDATEGDILKALDIGALGIIVPMVETAAKAQAAVTFAKYPPVGKRSTGGNQASGIWPGYRDSANDNIMIVVQIENPAGVDNIDKIAAVPGVDVVFIASTDLGRFASGKQGEPRYEELVTRALNGTFKAGKKLGGPHAWRERKGYTFFQGPGTSAIIRSGAQAQLGIIPASAGGR